MTGLQHDGAPWEGSRRHDRSIHPHCRLATRQTVFELPAASCRRVGGGAARAPSPASAQSRAPTARRTSSLPVDVFDSDRLDTITVRRALDTSRTKARSRGCCCRAIMIRQGPVASGSASARIGLPANVVALSGAAPISIASNAVVLPAPLTSKNPGRDPTEWMDRAATPPGTIRIGLAHGSVHGFSSEGESSVAIARDRAARAGLSYLALGDWHGKKRIDERTWYSGTPEPDRFPDNEPGYVLAVTIEGKRPLRSRPFNPAGLLGPRPRRPFRTRAISKRSSVRCLRSAAIPKRCCSASRSRAA